LLLEIVKIELVLADLLFELFSLLLVELCLGPFHEGGDISHPQDPLCHPFRIEHIQRIQFFAHAHELDGLLHGIFDG
jgi:hypothetical protein